MIKSLKILALIFVMIFGFGVVQGFGQISSTDEKDVWKLEEAFYESIKNGDLNGHMALWHKDALLWGWRTEYPLTKVSYERFWKDAKFKIDSYNLEWPKINIVGNTAVVYFAVTLEGYSTEPPHKVRVIHIWTKEDKNWLFIGGMTYKR